MILELLVIAIVLIVGVNLIVFASRIGAFIFNISEDMRKSMGDSSLVRFLHTNWWLSWATIEHRVGLTADIWLIRIVGMGFVGGAIVLLFVVTFT